jgi:hypothetical protein
MEADRLTALVKPHYASVAVLVGTSCAEGTGVFQKPFITGATLFIEIGQATRIPVGITTRLNIAGIHVWASRSKGPIAASEQL